MARKEAVATADGGPPEVTLETSMGPFTVEMYYHHAPRTCENFIKLARKGYYNNVKFHRIIKVRRLSTFLLFLSLENSLLRFYEIYLFGVGFILSCIGVQCLFCGICRISLCKEVTLPELAGVVNPSTGLCSHLSLLLLACVYFFWIFSLSVYSLKSLKNKIDNILYVIFIFPL